MNIEVLSICLETLSFGLVLYTQKIPYFDKGKYVIFTNLSRVDNKRAGYGSPL